MILVDTGIWIDHLAASDPDLDALLGHGEVLMHPFVVGEIALGNLRARATTLGWLARLPQAQMASPDDLLQLLDSRSLYGRGIGYVDAHLLASALLEAAKLWTRDRRLLAAAADIGLAYTRLQ